MVGFIEQQPKSKHDPQIPIRPIIQVIGPSIAYVELTRGFYSLIDSEDSEIVGQSNWQTKDSGHSDLVYAKRVVRADGKKTAQYLHAFLFGSHADHSNGNGLDNRRSANLRSASRSENNANRHRQCNNTTGFKGVSFHKPSKRYNAIISFNGTRKYLGGFATAENAYVAYCTAAAAIHGQFARVA